MVKSPPAAWWDLRGWALWRLGAPGTVFLLASELVAAALTAARFRHSWWPHSGLVSAVVLLGLAVLYGEASDRIERLRRFLGVDGIVSNHNSVVCLAGLLTLPLNLAAALVLGVYAHTYQRARRHNTLRPHRLIFSAAASMLATFIADDFYHALHGQLGVIGVGDAGLVIVTVAVYTSANLGVLLVGMYLVGRPASWRSVLPDREQITYENTTLVLGVVTAVVIAHAAWISPLLLILVAALHRSSLVAELQHAATRDTKTGLLNSGAWYAVAENHLMRCRASGEQIAVLLVDLDHFKRVNDTHGHLTGDAALRAVADILAVELRDYDAVGRYGGEEFIVLLPGAADTAAALIADRLGRRIREGTAGHTAPVTASIGVAAARPVPGRSLDDLIAAADLALYEAKDAGRDRVRVAASLDRSEPDRGP